MWGMKRVLLGRGFLCVNMGSEEFKLRDSSQFAEAIQIWNNLLDSHSTIGPLRFFQYVQT
jgi:hypothetical protein